MTFQGHLLFRLTSKAHRKRKETASHSRTSESSTTNVSAVSGDRRASRLVESLRMLSGHQAGLSGTQTLTLSAGPLFLSWAFAGSRLGVDVFSVNVVLPYSDDPESRTPRDIKVISSISISPLDIHCIQHYIYKRPTHPPHQRLLRSSYYNPEHLWAYSRPSPLSQILRAFRLSSLHS